jgi:hypothetical protein
VPNVEYSYAISLLSGMPILKLLTLLVLLIISALNAAAQAGTGSIEGTVVDARGRGVARAWVSALGTKPLGGRVPGVRSDKEGNFAIHSLDWDEYGVQACKEEDDVPCGPFFYRGETKQVRLSPQNPSATAEIRLGLKGGAINWTVRDASTGKPLAAEFMFRPLQHPERFVSGYFEGTILIPASMDFSLEVSASGFKAWSYADQYDPPRPLRLGPGAHIRLDINLQPLR